jgi:hypothetical protein
MIDIKEGSKTAFHFHILQHQRLPVSLDEIIKRKLIVRLGLSFTLKINCS